MSIETIATTFHKRVFWCARLWHTPEPLYSPDRFVWLVGIEPRFPAYGGAQTHADPTRTTFLCVTERKKQYNIDFIYAPVHSPPPHAGANLCRFPVCKNAALLSAVVSGNFHQNSAKPRNMTLGGIYHQGVQGGGIFRNAANIISWFSARISGRIYLHCSSVLDAGLGLK